MDKTWIKAQITSTTFKDGVKSFIDFARVTAIRGSIACPCYRCCNDKWFDINTVHAHILRFGFLPAYTTWTSHGEYYASSPLSQPSSVLETFPAQDDIRGLVQDAFGVNSLQEQRESRLEGDIGEASGVDPNTQEDNSGAEDIRYKKLLEDCEKELYPGCKYSSLSFTLHLYHIKCISGISNKAFGMLLELLIDAFSHLTSLPSSTNEAKKLTRDLGLGYQKIHACPNDCMLYWHERETQQSCHICNASLR